MAGRGISQSGVNYKIGQSLPRLSSLSDVIQEVLDMHQTLLVMIQSLTENHGAGFRDPQTWNQVAGLSLAINSGNLGRFYTFATQDIPEGALISVVNSTTTVGFKLASAVNNNSPAIGYCSSPGGILTGKIGEGTLGTGVIRNLSGLVAGHHYFLSTGPNGTVTDIAPGAAGNIEQSVGFALSTSELFFNLSGWIPH